MHCECNAPVDLCAQLPALNCYVEPELVVRDRSTVTVNRLCGWSYAGTKRFVSDSLVLRQ